MVVGEGRRQEVVEGASDSTRVRRVTRAAERVQKARGSFSANHHLPRPLVNSILFRLLCMLFVFWMDGLGTHALMPGDMAHNAFVRLTCDVEERHAWSTLD